MLREGMAESSDDCASESSESANAAGVGFRQKNTHVEVRMPSGGFLCMITVYEYFTGAMFHAEVQRHLTPPAGLKTLLCRHRHIRDNDRIQDILAGAQVVQAEVERVPSLCLRQAEFGWSAGRLKAAGYTAATLNAAGFPLAEMKEVGFTAREVKEGGYALTPEHVEHVGFTADDFKTCGLTSVECRRAGFSVAQCIDAGFDIAVVHLGFALCDIITSRRTHPTLYANPEALLTAEELLLAGFTEAHCADAGFTTDLCADDDFNTGYCSSFGSLATCYLRMMTTLITDQPSQDFF
eukprot:TRINITY_DN9178_c0_g1_i1.p1 TRINITY_DN9178_c0_g1~~TRINITY_DN9178_c0_g1_i1.p1  ORF type:complete len:295 (-),score=49.23 TRINITY_DN9178_c0_g1_i1:369-1253(-)